MMKIKIATWNMGYCFRRNLLQEAWQYYQNEIDADIYFFQESRPIDGIHTKENIIWEEKGRCQWGTGIYSDKYELTKEEIEKTSSGLEGAFTVARCDLTNNFTLTLISMYGLLEKIGGTGYSIPNLHRIFSDLTGLLKGHLGKRNIVLGGDLNASVQWDIKYGNKSHEILFDRIEDFKLIDCLAMFHNDYVQTLRYPRGNEKWQNDYLFVSSNITGRVMDCKVVDNEEVRRLSDHNPVLITLEI